MKKVELLSLMYPSGTRIKLIKMNDPPETDPLPPGSIGTIDHVDDGCQIHMQWDCGRSLALIPGVDQYQVLSFPKKNKERRQSSVPSADNQYKNKYGEQGCNGFAPNFIHIHL